MHFRGDPAVASVTKTPRPVGQRPGGSAASLSAPLMETARLGSYGAAQRRLIGARPVPDLAPTRLTVSSRVPAFAPTGLTGAPRAPDFPSARLAGAPPVLDYAPTRLTSTVRARPRAASAQRCTFRAGLGSGHARLRSEPMRRSARRAWPSSRSVGRRACHARLSAGRVLRRAQDHQRRSPRDRPLRQARHPSAHGVSRSLHALHRRAPHPPPRHRPAARAGIRAVADGQGAP